MGYYHVNDTGKGNYIKDFDTINNIYDYCIILSRFSITFYVVLSKFSTVFYWIFLICTPYSIKIASRR